MKTDVIISEVGPRDGLQSIKSIMPTETKKAWIQALSAAGVSEIEVGSFVPYGVKAAAENGADKISIPFSMSESHSLKNVNKTHEQMLLEIQACCEYRNTIALEKRPTIEVGLSTAFGCTIEGEVPEGRVIALAEKVVALGVDEVGLSDTTGVGNPAQLKRLTQGIWQHCGRDKLNGVHLHNTRGQGLANALMAIELGMTTLDSSLSGLGGCPWAPGASGNIVTEDLVFLLESMGLNTGIDLAALIEVRELVQAALPNETLHGFTPQSGLPLGWPYR